MDQGQCEFDPPVGSLKASVGRGAIVTALSQAVQVGAQIASVLILSRLLDPGDFGLMAMIAPVTALVGLLQDFGLVQATVQKECLKRDEVNFLFWLSIFTSFAVAIFLIALAPLVAIFYDEPRALALTAAMALPMVVNAMGAQQLALLNRRMKFLKMAIISIVSSIMTVLTAVIWSLVEPSYWALFGAVLVGAITSTVMAWIYSSWRPGVPKLVKDAKSLVGFGAGITGFSFSNFFARNLDNILIGRFWGEKQLGYYDRAYKLLLFPLNQVANPLSRLMIPALSRMLPEHDRYREAFFRVLKLSLFVSLPAIAFAVGMGDIFIPILLGEQWTQSGQIFLALGFAGIVQALNNPSGWLFISQGRSADFMKWGLVQASIAGMAFVAGLPWGAQGVAVAYAISEYLKTPFLWHYVGKKGPVKLSDVVRFCGTEIIACHIALGAVYIFHNDLAVWGVFGLVIALILSYTSFSIALLFSKNGRNNLKEIRSLSVLCVSKIRGMLTL